MCPLLKRGMDEPATATKRNVARIVENMAKLVDDPYEVEPFIPTLLPALNRAKEALEVDEEELELLKQAHGKNYRHPDMARCLHNVLALRKALSLSYASIWWLQSNGLLPVGYYETISSREDYED